MSSFYLFLWGLFYYFNIHTTLLCTVIILFIFDATVLVSVELLKLCDLVNT